jgi:hypothetical protein
VRTRAVALVLASALLSACAPGSLAISRVVTPKQAGDLVGTKLVPTAVIGDTERTSIPADAKITPDKVIISNARDVYVHKLQRGDVIELDAQERITAVRRGGDPAATIHFEPGTASSPHDSDEVRGKLVAGETVIPLKPTDRIEVGGTFEVDDAIPGGGHVVTHRYTAALVTGVIILSLAYLPSAYAGGASSRRADRTLLLPVAGPWIDLAGRERCTTPVTEALPLDPCVGETAARVGLITSGVAQALGAILIAAGLPSHPEVLDDGVAKTPENKGVWWSVLPSVSPRAGGASIVGRF